MNPCYKCEDRHQGCHGECSAYERYSAERAAEIECRKTEIAANNDFMEAKRRIRRIAESDK